MIHNNPYICDKDTQTIVDVVLSVGEKVSDITLYPYQREFARRIVESVLVKDAETITALFSRQCLTPDTRVLTPKGSVPISQIKRGDSVVSYVNGAQVIDKVDSIWSDVKKVRHIRLSDGSHVDATPETRFYNGNTGRWDGLQGRNTSMFKRRFYTVNNCETCEGAPTNTPTSEVHDPAKTAEQAMLLLFGRDDPHMYITEMLGRRLNGYFRTEYALNRFRESLGLKTSQTGSEGVYRTISVERPELDITYIYKFRLEIMRLVCSTMLYDRGLKKLDFLTRSTGVYRHTLYSFLSQMCLTPELRERVSTIRSATSILMLLPALEGHVDEPKIRLDVFNAPRMDSSYKVTTEDALGMNKTDRGMHKNVRHAVVDKRKKFLSLGGFARAYIERYGYRQWNISAPDWMFLRVTDASRLTMSETFDMETESTGNFFANELLVHNCGKSESLKIAVLGLILWMPSLAKTYPQDKRFERFKGGFWVGLFAPNLKTQVKSIYNRIRNTLKGKHGKAFMAGLDLDFVINQAFEFVLDNGSRVYGGAASLNANIESQTFHLVIGDEAQDIDSFKWKKSIVPMTTFTAGSKVLVGTANTTKSNFYEQIGRNVTRLESGGKRNHFQVDFTIPSAENPDYALSVKQAIAELGFDSDEFQMAYNNKFIFSRGMAVDPELLNFNSAEHPRGIIFTHDYVKHYTGDKKVVVGVDIGKKHDPTVCTAVEVDTSDPIEIVHFRTYKKKEIAKMEIIGDDIEAQIPQILDFIDRMQATTIAVDATGGGDHFFDMLSKRAPKLNWIPFVFSQKSRSELWKAFLSDLSTGRVQLAGGLEARETIEYYKTLKELGELEKHYNGQYLACQAPTSRNAHDDYAVSLALACWACKDYFVGELTVTEGFFKGRRNSRRRRKRR